jgi:hypothetical protein
MLLPISFFFCCLLLRVAVPCCALSFLASYCVRSAVVESSSRDLQPSHMRIPLSFLQLHSLFLCTLIMAPAQSGAKAEREKKVKSVLGE